MLEFLWFESDIKSIDFTVTEAEKRHTQLAHTNSTHN